MRALRIALKALAIIIGGTIIAFTIAILVMTQTTWGRERVRQFALGILEDEAIGVVRAGRISGNLLTGITVEDISVSDSSGRPFFTVDSVQARYRLLDFFNKRVSISDARLVRPIVILDERNGEWNYEHIFPGDTTPDTDTTSGFGDWVSIRDLAIVDGHLQVRTQWEPDTTVAAVRDSLIRAALAGDGRYRVEEIPGGYQRVMEFRQIDAEIPYSRIEDPDSATMIFDIAHLKMIAEPFVPPAADVRDLTGRFWVGKDSLWWNNVRAALPNSRVSGSGMYVLDDTAGFQKGDMTLRIRGEPAALADLRWVYPHFPSQGQGTLDFVMNVRADTTEFIGRNAQMTIGDARVDGNFGVKMSDVYEFHSTDLRFSSVDTRLLEEVAPTLDIPRRGVFSGRAAVAGKLDALRIDADVTFADASDGTSRVVAVGEMGFAGRAFRARDLELDLLPVQVALVRSFAPTLPIGGTIRGEATLNGSTASRFYARTDVVHDDRGARSHLIGNAALALGGERWMDVDLRARPLSLTTVGRFVPAARLHGSATGHVRARGPFRDLAVNADLRLPDGGVFLTNGTLDIASRDPGYDLTTTLQLFDVRSVTEFGPRTSLTALVSVRGRGVDPATMRASLAADMSRSQIDSVGFDSMHVRVAAADGMARIDSLQLLTSFARAHVDGTIGLTANHQGQLAYNVQVDSLGSLRRWLGVTDTTTVRPRPGRIAAALERARADSARLAMATEVERAAIGGPTPVLRADTAGLAIRRDTLTGSVYAAGTVRGSIRSFDIRGRAAAENVLYAGNAVRQGRIDYAVAEGGTAKMRVVVGAALGSVQTAGFALDSVETRMAYESPRANVELNIVEDSLRDMRLRADVVFHPEHSELHLQSVALRIDTTTWRSVRPGTIQWGRRGLEIDTLDLRSGENGRIFVNGRMPAEGSLGNMQIAVEGLEVGHLTTLLQSDVPLSGVLQVQARIQGTQRSPMFRGAVGLSNPVYDGTAVPDLRTSFQYANATFESDAQFVRGRAAPLLTARAVLPLNLAMSGVVGSRLEENRDMQLDVRADSMPLDVLPKFTDAVSEVRGRLIGIVSARGTPRQPRIAGAAAVDFASFRVVPMGVTLRDLFGAIRMRGDTVVIDSLAGRAGGGRVTVKGGLATADLNKIGFNLAIVADNALVMDNRQGRLRGDAEIEVKGPYDDVHVTGHASIIDGVIWIPESQKRQVISAEDPAIFAIVDTSVVTDRELLPAQSPLLKNLRMDVSLHIARDTWVRGRDANVEIYTPVESRHEQDLQILVDRRRSALSIEGRLNTDRGEYTFMGRRFILRQGSATFIGDPELNPLLQITGVHEIRLPGREALEIQVLIGGTMRTPKIALESSAQPPISQSDLLSYLAFGQSSSSLLQVEGSALSGPGTGSGNLVGNVAGLAARQLAGVAIGVMANEAERDLSRSLGADVFNIAPADVPAELSGSSIEALLQGTEIEVGRYIDRRTFVALQGRPSGTLPGIRIQHRMAKGFRIESSYEPRILLNEPTLSREVNLRQVRVLGGFLIREWRF